MRKKYERGAKPSPPSLLLHHFCSLRLLLACPAEGLLVIRLATQPTFLHTCGLGSRPRCLAPAHLASYSLCLVSSSGGLWKSICPRPRPAPPRVAQRRPRVPRARPHARHHVPHHSVGRALRRWDLAGGWRTRTVADSGCSVRCRQWPRCEQCGCSAVDCQVQVTIAANKTTHSHPPQSLGESNPSTCYCLDRC
jgi:hypothetical protein